MIKIDEKICTGCGACAGDCPWRTISMENEKAVYTGPCLLCGHCVAICPVAAVTIPEYDMADVAEYDEKNFSLDADNLLNAIKFRRSIRHYENKPIESEKLDKIIQAGRYSATAINMQNCKFVVVQKELQKLKELVWESVSNIAAGKVPGVAERYIENFAGILEMRKGNPPIDYLFRDAPAVVFVTSDKPIDVGLAAQNMELMAVSQGLGVLFNGFMVAAASASPEIIKWFDIDERKIFSAMLLGYPEMKYHRTAPRRPANLLEL